MAPDLATLGYSSPLAAAMALLGGGVRVVDEDADDPVVAIEDALALVPHRGLMGSWPSLYRTLCEVVLGSGAPVPPGESDCARVSPDARCLLLSTLRPLLQRHWHTSFDENTLGYLSPDGSFSKFKKMKHFLVSILRWAGERRAWRETQARSGENWGPVDEVLAPRLQVVTSCNRNDLLLVCSVDTSAVEAVERRLSLLAGDAAGPAAGTPGTAVPPAPPVGFGRAGGGPVDRGLADGSGGAGLGSGVDSGLADGGLAAEGPGAWRPASAPTGAPVGHTGDPFDDPFEPPPEAQPWRPEAFALPCKVSFDASTTDAGSECSFEQSSLSNFAVDSADESGATTPVHHAFVPLWFPMEQSQVPCAIIPEGIVRTACEHFERIAKN